MKKFHTHRLILLVCSLLGVGGLAGLTQAGQVTYNFDTDPTATLQILGNNPQPWQASDGNPGGFLALTYPENSQNAHIIFPDLDPGKVVTAFSFSCDLRIGNSSGARAADGFSINFARANDLVISLKDSDPGRGFAGDTMAGGAENASLPETGTTTGIAICFDTWSGNALPDGADIEGIIVRVDNKTVLRKALSTRHGACADTTSLQTGPRDLDFWASGGDVHMPDAWKTLCWQPFSVDLDETGKLTVKWKGVTVLDKYQTTYFPSPGRLIFAGRTGGANEQTHVDNIKLTTVAVTLDTEKPTSPTNLRAAEAGVRRVLLTWGASTDNSGKVAYRIEKDGQALSALITDTKFEETGLKPATKYTYRVRATDVSGNLSDWTTAVTATTVTDVDDVGFLLAEIYDSITGTAVQGLYDDAKFPASPDRGVYLNGLSFGEWTGFGNTYGGNFGIKISGVLTAPETGQFDFFVRSDDASQFFLNTSGATIPDPKTATPIAEETGCCAAFQEPGDPRTTAAPISLQAGRQYGFVFIVKEGGGGDWGQVAMRKVGDTTAAASLQPIRGAILAGKADAVGAVVNITKAPQSVTLAANERLTLSVEAQTASPYTTDVLYQWYRNGAIISGATTATYSIPVVSSADNGAKFKVLVAVPGVSKTSAEATVTVTADTKPPTITKVVGSAALTQATVTFSEPVTAATAAVAANYALSGGLTVSAAQVVDQWTVRLTTAKQAENTDYTLTVTGLKDNAGNTVAVNTTGLLRSFVFVPGKMTYEYWSGISGTTLAQLQSDARYPNNPSGSQLVTSYAAPVDWANNFGARVSGWVTPATTGNYVFFISADDMAELYLSTDDNPANKKLIAREAGWSGANQWLSMGGGSDLAEKRSDQNTGTQWPGKNTIALTAGKRYYTELIYKEGGGGDNGAANWKLASAADPADTSATILTGPLIGTFGPPPPKLVSAGAIGAKVGVAFSDVLDKTSAETAANYTVSGVTVSKAALIGGASNAKYVDLTVSAAPTAGFTVTVKNVADTAGNAITSASVNGQLSDLKNQDIGTPASGPPFTDPLIAGTASYLGNDAYIVGGGGHDIWDSADGFHYAYKEFNGPFDAQMRVEWMNPLSGLSHSSAWAKTELMVRESTAAGSRHVSICTTRSDGVNRIDGQWRDTANAASGNSQFTTNSVPYPNAWIRIVREDATKNVFKLYHGTDGVNWTLGTTHTVPGAVLPAKVLIGIAETSHDNDKTEPLSFGIVQNFSIKQLTAAWDPQLKVAFQTGKLVISWGSGTLLGSAAVNGPYTAVAGATSPFNVTPQSASMFYKVQQ